MMFILSFQPLMLIVPDVQDVYTPLESDVIVQLSEVRFSKMLNFYEVDYQFFLTFPISLIMSIFVSGNSAVNIWSCCLKVFQQCFRVIEPPSQPSVLQSKYVFHCILIMYIDHAATAAFFLQNNKVLELWLSKVMLNELFHQHDGHLD